MKGVAAKARAERIAFRDQSILAALARGVSRNQIAATYRVSRHTVRRIEKASADGLIEIPGWVPRYLHHDYLEIAQQDGEEAAAAYCRRAKRSPILHLGPCEVGGCP